MLRRFKELRSVRNYFKLQANEFLRYSVVCVHKWIYWVVFAQEDLKKKCFTDN